MTRYRIAVDTGGTFTDVVVLDDAGRLTFAKALTTPDRAFAGIRAALDDAAGQLGLPARDLLTQTTTFIYGTTRATNAIVTGATARTAFLTTRGFPDILVLREGGKQDPFDHRRRPPAPYVPKRLTFEIDERVTAAGEILVPLSDEHVLDVVEQLRRAAVEAIAVTLLWSIVEPAHELRIGELLRRELPEVPYTLSHELNPIVREYRRASSAAIDASLKPLMQAHLRGLAEDLRASAFTGRLLVVTSFGGVLGADDVIAKPIYLVNSGPSMAPVAASSHVPDARSAIVCDMGGTTLDVSVIHDGRIQFSRESWLGQRFHGHMTGLSSVDVKSVGAGGGSIAWIDPGGLLRVGPQSAGAEPGPACYGRGGTLPTVTDAAIAVGFLDPERFLGGRLELDADAAQEAIRGEVAGPLGLTVEAAGHAILAVANEQMIAAIREITVNQGLDPRDAVIVAGGGAAGMTIAAVAQSLGCDRVVVPRTASTLSAAGGQFADLVTEFTAMHKTDTASFDTTGVNAVLAGLEARVERFLDRLDVPERRRRRRFSVEARYRHQTWELEVQLPAPRFDDAASATRLVDAFGDEHERVFAVREPGQHVECLLWRGRAIAQVDKPQLALAAPNGGTGQPRQVADAFFGDGRAPTPRYAREQLGVEELCGPAIVDEPGTTIVVPPGWRLAVLPLGDFLLRRAA